MAHKGKSKSGRLYNLEYTVMQKKVYRRKMQIFNKLVARIMKPWNELDQVVYVNIISLAVTLAV